jgi:hypothetical protein
VSELDKLEVAVGECREMIREAHAATKDLRSAVREAKEELRALTRDQVTAQLRLEVSGQLDDLREKTGEAVTAATQKVIAEFDRFGESLLGKEAYWQRASGRRSAARPDTGVVTLDIGPDEDEGLIIAGQAGRQLPARPSGRARPQDRARAPGGSRAPRQCA